MTGRAQDDYRPRTSSRLPPGITGRDLCTSVPACRPDDAVSTIRRELVGPTHEHVAELAVCEEDRLVGLLPLTRVLGSPDTALAKDLMDPDPPLFTFDGDLERAAWTAVQHGESSLAVVDDQGRFVGLVPPARLLGVLLRAHDQDFARLRRFLDFSRQARTAAQEPVVRRLRHRVGWLALGLAGAAASAWLVGLFEGRLEADVRLAFFIPGVVYLADAVGTQTEAIVVRGLSVGAPVRRALALETLTGPTLGLAVGITSLAAVWWALGDGEVAATVALSLFAACGVATALGAAIPILLARLGRDPAFASGPVATVVQDLLSLLIYFGAAVLIMG